MFKKGCLFIIIFMPLLLCAYPQQDRYNTSEYGYEPARADSAHGFDVTKYELYLNVNAATHYINGTVNAEVTATDEITTIAYNLIGLTVDEVLVNDETATYSHTGGFLTIQLGLIEMGEEFTTSVTYHGYPQSSPGYGGGMFWSTTYVFTVSDPDASRYWWPCYDHPWDKAVTDLHITLRDDWLVAANGIRTGIEDNGDGTHTTHWIGENPMTTYLVCFHGANFVEFEQGCTLPSGEELLVQHFCPPNQLNNAQADFADMPWMIEYFSEIFGEYPFEKFGNCVVPMTIFAGMEHQTMVTLANYLINGQGTYETVFAHELAHQWFGDCVAFLDFPHVWLSEGFATYSEALWTEEHYGFEAMLDYVQSDIQGYYLNWAGGGNYTIYNPTLYNYFTPPEYEKAASVLHMLRLSVGDENFFEILQQYFATYMNGNTVTAEFKEVVEDVTGEDYDQFFSQWIYGSGVPSYEYTWFLNPNMAIPRIQTYVKTSSSSGTDFSCRVPFKVIYENGNSDSVLVNSSADGELTIEILNDIIVEEVQFDPHSWLLDRGVTYRRMEMAGVYPYEGGVALYWNPLWENELDVAGYVIYRSEEPEGPFIQLNGELITGESYIDTGLTIGETYYYKVAAALDEDWFSEPSTPVAVEIESWPLDQGILLVDETADGNGNPGNPSDEQVDEFYTSILGADFTSYDYNTSGALTQETVRNYSTIIWHDEDLSQKNFEDNEGVLGSYIYAGGNLLISGWKTTDEMSGQFLEQFAGSENYVLVTGQEFVGATSEIYTSLEIEAAKIPAAFNGRLPYVAVYPEGDESVYAFNGIDGSAFAGMPCAVKSSYEGNCFILGFPLYFCYEEGAASFMSEILEEFGETPAEPEQIEKIYLLLSAYPNPMIMGSRAVMSISYDLGQENSGRISIYNLKGQKIAERAVNERKGNFIWQPEESLASGVYYLRLQAKDQCINRKVLLLK
ncbi:MAG: T9SS type A sorting domain-containing protein [Candidatus Cloacimonetes bacterium]|nr:T9SS type A sorting domain-containing protein [Candidatus Cloacimonadota bacterium]